MVTILRAFCLFAVAAALACLPRLAHAHGARPLASTGYAASEGPGPGAQLRLVPMTSGALVSTDGGGHFAWICEEALVGPVADDVTVGVTAAGSLLLGNGNDGLRVSRDGGCSWRPSGAFAPPHDLSDFAIWPARGDDAWVVTNNDVAQGHGAVWRTTDGGASYRRLNFSVPNVYLTGVAVWDELMVVAGTNNRARQSAQLYVSRDGGATFVEATLRGAPDLTGEAKPYILDGNKVALGALDASNNSAVVLLAPQAEGPYWPAYHSWEPIRGVAALEGGQHIVVASTKHLAISRDGGLHFVQAPHPQQNACVGRDGQQLFACGSYEGGDDFSVAWYGGGTSVPQLRPHVRFSSLRGPYHCPEDSPVAQLCLPQWERAAQRFGAPAAPPATPDATTAKRQGCACSAGSDEGAGGAVGQATAALVTWYILRGARVGWPVRVAQRRVGHRRGR